MTERFKYDCITAHCIPIHICYAILGERQLEAAHFRNGKFIYTRDMTLKIAQMLRVILISLVNLSTFRRNESFIAKLKAKWTCASGYTRVYFAAM